VFFGVGY